MKHLHHYAGAFALSAFLLVPSAALAQADDAPRTAAQLVIDVDRSERLFHEAYKLSDDKANWVEAAERYVESARLRPYGDTQAYLALNRAGQMFAHVGEVSSSSRSFASAGVRALETGQIYEAALAFANAAEMGQKDPISSGRLMHDFYVRTAHRLSESPALSDEQRQQVRRRLGLDKG